MSSTDLVRVDASVMIDLLPPSAIFAEALKEAISRQPGVEELYPGGAQQLATDVVSDPEMVDMLQRFPTEVSLEQLIAKANIIIFQLVTSASDLFGDFEEPDYYDSEREYSRGIDYLEAVWEQIVKPLWEQVGQDPYPEDDFIEYSKMTDLLNNYTDALDYGYYNLAEPDVDPWIQFKGSVRLELLDPANQFLPAFAYIIFDLSKLQGDLSALYELLSWNSQAEQMLIDLLNDKLANLHDIHIETQVVPVPFREDFQSFLDGMKKRQELLRDLRVRYFGAEGDEGKDSLDTAQDKIAQVLTPWGTLVKKGMDIDLFFFEDILAPAAGKVSKDAERFLKTAPREFLIKLSSGTISFAQVGINFETALRNDPKMALAGMAVGMIEASPLGAFLDIAFVYVGSQFEQYNQYGANLPTIRPGWWHDLIGADNPDPNFQAGRAAGSLGMSVSDIVVGQFYTAPSDTPLGGSLGVSKAGNVAVAETSGVMTLEQAKALGLVGTRLLGIGGGLGNLGAAISTEGNSSKNPRTPQERLQSLKQSALEKSGTQGHGGLSPQDEAFIDRLIADPTSDDAKRFLDFVDRWQQPDSISGVEDDFIHHYLTHQSNGPLQGKGILNYLERANEIADQFIASNRLNRQIPGWTLKEKKGMTVILIEEVEYPVPEIYRFQRGKEFIIISHNGNIISYGFN